MAGIQEGVVDQGGDVEGFEPCGNKASRMDKYKGKNSKDRSREKAVLAHEAEERAKNGGEVGATPSPPVEPERHTRSL